MSNAALCPSFEADLSKLRGSDCCWSRIDAAGFHGAISPPARRGRRADV